MKVFTSITIAFFTVISFAHLLRLFFGWEVIVTGFAIPVWWSAPGMVVAGGLAFMVWRENHTHA